MRTITLLLLLTALAGCSIEASLRGGNEHDEQKQASPQGTSAVSDAGNMKHA